MHYLLFDSVEDAVAKNMCQKITLAFQRSPVICDCCSGSLVNGSGSAPQPCCCDFQNMVDAPYYWNRVDNLVSTQSLLEVPNYEASESFLGTDDFSSLLTAAEIGDNWYSTGSVE